MAATSTYGNLKFAGQQNEVTFNVEAAVLGGDAVGATATAGLLGRATDGDELIGIVTRKEADNVATVKVRGCNEVVTAKRTGAISLGVQALAVAGDGTVKAGTGTSTFTVIGTETVSTVDYVTFIL